MAQSERARLLLVDDDTIVLESLGELLRDESYEVAVAGDVGSAMGALGASRFDLVITDVSMPTCDGFDLLRQIRRRHEEVVVILMTGYGMIESAVEAIKEGAYDYLTKPIIEDDVRMAVRRALKQKQLLAENRSLREALADRYSLDNLITADARMAKVLEVVRTVANASAAVLVSGEPGTGKSMIARAIHAQSLRCDMPFVEVACGALGDALLECELFGCVRSAVPRGMPERPGRFADTDGGTVFLDDFDSAGPQLQVKLLRLVQEGRMEAVGSDQTAAVDVRVILGTSRNLEQAVREGRFRSDLCYQANVVNIELPPLRNRAGDIHLLAEHFLARCRATLGKRIDGFADDALRAMREYEWPGNVRELEVCVERAAAQCRDGSIGAHDLPTIVALSRPATPDSAHWAGSTLADALVEPEKQIILSALAAHNNSRQDTARTLGINRTTLYKKMRKFGLLS
jgi:DNA-binding NtrC family response regulator